MRKILWGLIISSLCISGVLFSVSPNAKAQEVNFSPMKKIKKNYRSLSAFPVSGDGSDSDASIINTSAYSVPSTLYRQVAIPGLRISDPFPFRIFKKSASMQGFEEENWGGMTNYFISNGFLWINYGQNSTFGGQTTFSDIGTYRGDYRYFNYFGGTKAKKRKRQAYRTYNLTTSGDENNADASGSYASNPTMINYYRKLSIPELKTDNLVDYRIYRKNSFYQGFSDESWTAVGGSYFITNGYIYVAYGYKSTAPGSIFYSQNNGDYRIYIYSNGKMKKKKLTRQYTKKYTFNVPGGEDTADKISTTTNFGSTYNLYYKKIALPEAKMANFPNMRVMRKNNFIGSLPSESWSQGGYNIVDGYLWINYGSKLVNTGVYSDSGSVDYQVFLYK
jgi:hypothetical protein